MRELQRIRVEDLVAEAVSLPVEERTVLVDSLLRGLNAADESVEREWRAEARRRLEQVGSGAARTIPGDEVFTAIRKRFAG
jgi:putative addiction module component (TIGR02574 family)